MRNTLKIVLVVGIFLLSVLADAISLGSSSDVNYLTLKPGAYGVFETSFFNMGEEPIKVEFEVEYPSDLRIEVVPGELALENELTDNPDSSGSWLILDGGKRYVKTHPVRVYVKIPPTISRNIYRIKLIATATGKESSGGGGFRQSLAQVREIPLTAYVPGRVNRESVEIIRKDATSGDEVKEEAEQSFISEYQGGTVSPGGGGSTGRSLEKRKDTSRKSEDKKGILGISKDSEGNTQINLPTGKISLNKEQTETAIDIGLITLIISIASLIVRVLK